jgi:hypothetical protein
MKRACILYFVLFVLLCAAYFVFLQPRVETPGQYLLSFFGALSTVMLGGSLAGLTDTLRCTAALRRDRRGERLRDGRWEAVSGPIHARGTPLRSPFGGVPCAAYEYDAERTIYLRSGRRLSPSKESSVFGWAMTPCVIQSSRGQVSLLGWPLLDAFPENLQSGPSAHERAKDYVRDTAFTRLPKSEALKLLSMMEQAIVDDDGNLRTDCRSTDEPDPLQGRDLKEKVVPEGEVVTALGLYSALKGGFAPQTKRLGTANRLLPGERRAVGRRLWLKALSMLVFAVVFFALIHGLIAVILYGSD